MQVVVNYKMLHVYGYQCTLFMSCFSWGIIYGLVLIFPVFSQQPWEAS